MIAETDALNSLKILHLEDSPLDAEIIRERLTDAGFSCQLDWAANEQQFTAFLHSGGYDLVLADFHLPGIEGTEALRLTKSLCPGVPFICVSGAIGEEKAVQLLKEGATDYLPKERLDKLSMVIERALSEVKERTAHRLAEEEKALLEAKLIQAQKMESIGRLAGGVAHDFNNMLGVILGNVDLATRKIAPDHPLQKELRGISNAAERAAGITRQLLAFARKQTVVPKVLDLNETVEAMLKILRRLIGENIELTWLPGAGLWPVKLDPSQEDQILANLCVNARDAIPDVGKLIIETGNTVFNEADCAKHAELVPGEYVMLAISDSGCGMDKETQEKIFEPFFTTKEVGQGTGLGLATVYGIVKQNNGFINVYSEPGQGTTFRIYLPRHPGQVPAAEETASRAVPKSCGETVLLVEDEPSLLQMTCEILEMLEYQVLAADSPDKAIHLCAEHPGEIHLLITDVVMPGMNGRTLAEKLRPTRAAMKCLFTSGYTADVIAHHGVLEEGVQFIQKPCSISDLAIKIRAVLAG